MRIVVDTNVLVSATFWEGDSFRILEMAEKSEIDIILSKEILKEYIDVLGYKEIKDKVGKKNLNVRYAIEKIISMCKFVEPITKINLIKEDTKDNMVLECAITAKAKYIVSQDRHILKIRTYKGIQILSPGEFIRLKRK